MKRSDIFSSPNVLFVRSGMMGALRTGWACGMAWLLVRFGNMKVQWMAFPVFSYVVAVTVVGEFSTLGGALKDGAAVVVGCVEGVGMSMLALQLLPPRNLSFSITILCIAINTLIIVYPKSIHVLSKRVALTQTAIIYSTAYIQAESMDRINFPLRMGGTAIVGATCAVLALLFPFPRLAFSELQMQAKLSARVISERLKIIVYAFSIEDSAESSSLSLQAHSLGRMESTICGDVYNKQDDIEWETILTRHLSTLVHVIGKDFADLKEDLVALEWALQHDKKSSCRRILHATAMQESLIYLSDLVPLSLMHAASAHENRSPMANLYRQTLMDEFQKALHMFDKSLASSIQKEQVDASALTDHKPMFQARKPAFFFLFMLRRLATKAMAVISNLQISDTSKLQHGKAEAYAAFRDDLENQVGKDHLSNSSLMTSSCKLCLSMVGSKVKEPEGPWIDFKELVKSHLPNFEQARTALKMALCLTMATFLGMWFDKGHGYWAAITVSWGFGNTEGGSFKVANLRVQGTVAGSIYGLVAALLTQNIPYLRLPCLIPWVIFTTFLRKTKTYEYAGAVSAFTGAIVILSSKHRESDQSFTIIRIVEAFLGMASYVLVELVVLPRRASTLARDQLVVPLRRLKEFVSSVLSAHQSSTLQCPSCCIRTMNHLKVEEKAMRSLIAYQDALVKEASQEPELWFTPFPANVHMKLINAEGRMTELLHFAICSLESILAISSTQNSGVEHLHKTVEPVLGVVKERITTSLEFVGRAVEMKSLEEIRAGSEKDDECGVKQLNCIASRYKGKVEELMEKGLQELESEVLNCDMKSGEGEDASRKGSGVTLLMLAFNTLAFCLEGVIAEAVEIEEDVRELLQVENPWSLVRLDHTLHHGFIE